MSSQLSPAQIGKRLQQKRKIKGLSQKDVSKILKIPRSSLAQIELGKRSLSVIELLKLSEVLYFSLDQFLSSEYQLSEKNNDEVNEPGVEKEYTRVSEPKLNTKKLKNVLLYILEQCAGKPNVGETVLNKLLYFSDFNYYETYEAHLTGATYKKLPFGPVPEGINEILNRMIDNGLIHRIKTMYHGYPQNRYIPLEKADLTSLSAAEKDIIDQVIDRFSDWSASSLSDYSHQDMPWRATKEGELIDYELCLYRETPFSVRTYTEATAALLSPLN